MNRPCPKCRDQGRDAKGDHLWLMRDGVTYCCNKPYHPVYYERNNEEVQEVDSPMISLNEVKTLPFFGSLERKITKETHEVFKVRTELSEEDGRPVAIYYPETIKNKLFSYKVRRLPKNFITLGNGTKGTPDFFGQFRSPKSGKKVLVTGGEEDAMAAFQMLKDRYPDNDYAVVSLPRGEDTSLATVSENLEFLRGFEEVIIATDMDTVGRKALGSIATVVGEKARVLNISEKDCSDMLVKNKAKEFVNAYYNPREYRPSQIVSVEDIIDKASEIVPWGLNYPFESLTKMTYGMKQGGEIISIGASPGAGKSSFIRHIQEQLMFVHGESIAVFDIEEKATGALKHLIGGIMNKPIHKPDCIYDVSEAKRIGNLLKGKVYFYDGLTEDWAEVKDHIRYFASKGIRFYFIDPLSALVEHLNASEGNQELGKIMRDMRRFRVEQGLTFFSVNHLNNPTGGKDHGAGGDVYGGQFSGSRAQWKYSTALWGLARNQLAETQEERNICKISVIKDRLGGNTGSFYLYYNSLTGKFEDSTYTGGDF